jgi:hypothetical protein
MNRSLSLFLIAALSMLVAARPTLAAPRAERTTDKKAARTARIRDDILRLGTGPDTRIKLERRDGTRLEGIVAASDESSFTVADAQGRTTQVPYGDVTKVKGQNLATGWKIAIGVGIGVGVAFLVLAIFLATSTR